MVDHLEKGIDRANKRQYRRTVICMDGLRSCNIPWEQAKKAAMGIVKLYLRTETVNPENTIREILVNISTIQDQQRSRQALRMKPEPKGPAGESGQPPRFSPVRIGEAEGQMSNQPSRVVQLSPSQSGRQIGVKSVSQTPGEEPGKLFFQSVLRVLHRIKGT